MGRRNNVVNRALIDELIEDYELLCSYPPQMVEAAGWDRQLADLRAGRPVRVAGYEVGGSWLHHSYVVVMPNGEVRATTA